MNNHRISRAPATAAPGRRGLLAAALWLAAGALAGPLALGADGLIVVHDPPSLPGHFRFAPLQVRYHQVTVDIRELAATTTVDQEFFNPSDAVLEGTYLFPLPAGAVIDRLSMEIDGKMMQAELLPADQARAIYEQIVRQLRDPALLEYAGRGAFRLRVFPIEARAAKRIRIRYTQLLKSDSGMSEYVYPLNTEKFSSAPLQQVSVTVTLDGKQPLKSLYSPSHDVEIRREGERRAVVGWEAREAWPDGDFKLVFARTPDPLGISLLTFREAGRDGYFLLLASPGLAEAGRVQPKDICFVLDTSGSMAGGKLEQARKALAFCLDNLNAGDRFEIVRFSSEAEALFGELRPAEAGALRRARDFVAGLKPLGGTAIGEALAKAQALGRPGAAERPYLVVFLTDGLPTVGETREDALVQSVLSGGGGAETRIFCFGVGTDVNTHLLDRFAEGSRAFSRYVLPGEDLELALSSFYTKIRDPVLSGLDLDFSNPAVRVSQLLPGRLPDLFNGDVLAVFGRYSGSGSAGARITGTLGGRKAQFTAEVVFPGEALGKDWIPRLWAARRVGWLLDEMRLRGESAELREEVVRLARDFGIVTPYTAYLVLEDEARRGVPVELRSFRELEADRAAAGSARRKLESVRAEAAAPALRSGRDAVDNALAVQGLKLSANEAQARQAEGLEKSATPAAPPGYRSAQEANFAGQVRSVNGRTFYQNGGVWTDAAAQKLPSLRRRQARFGSGEYFELLQKHRELSAFLALGSEIDVVVDGTLYQIRGN